MEKAGMRHTSVLLFSALVLTAALSGQFRAAAAEQTAAPPPAAAAAHSPIPTDRAAIEHALNRLAFGPRPGDIDRVEQAGLSTWIEAQLNPSSIEDGALAARLPQMPEAPAVVKTPQEARRFGRQSAQVLAAQKVLRAVYSERQLEEVLVDF